jgi:aldose 1-epimerase
MGSVVGAAPVSGPVPPSGTQHVIRAGDQEAVVTEVGAGLRTYTAGGRPVVEGFPVDEPSTGGRGQLLVPWPNRLRGGRYPWAGTTQQLDLSEPDVGGAIHGLTRWAPWRLMDREEHRVRLEHVLHARPGWPFVLRCTVEWALGDEGLVGRTTASNVGAGPCPYGTGTHPYLAAGPGGVDAAVVAVPADRRLEVDDDGIPTGEVPVDGTPDDLRRPQAVGDRHLDTTYTGLRRDADGRARVTFTPADGHGATLWCDEAYGHLQVFTGDTVPEVERRRTGLAVEPMTCAPDAFNSGAGLVVLQPGEAHVATWGIQPTT